MSNDVRSSKCKHSHDIPRMWFLYTAGETIQFLKYIYGTYVLFDGEQTLKNGSFVAGRD